MGNRESKFGQFALSLHVSTNIDEQKEEHNIISFVNS